MTHPGNSTGQGESSTAERVALSDAEARAIVGGAIPGEDNNNDNNNGIGSKPVPVGQYNPHDPNSNHPQNSGSGN